MAEIHTHDYDFLQDPTAFSNKGYILSGNLIVYLLHSRALKTGTIIKYHNPSYYIVYVKLFNVLYNIHYSYKYMYYTCFIIFF